MPTSSSAPSSKRNAPLAREIAAVPRVSAVELPRMHDQLLFDGPEAGRKLSAFWVLLALAAMIASAGIVSDSTATVIGAMIVAPLMTPIVGTVFSVMSGDRANLLRCLGLIVAGSVLVIAIGYLFGKLVQVPITAQTNAQVAGRVHPDLIDLAAALATGAVGSFAVIRPDVSDTLPGVAIAISLVPPLCVVGLTLESGAHGQAVGALLLFLTNVGAILFSGIVVMAIYRVFEVATVDEPRVHRRLASIVVAVFVIVLMIPLGVSGAKITRETLNRENVAPVAEKWAHAADWQIVSVTSSEAGVDVRASGGLPEPSPDQLRKDLDAAGLGRVHVVLELVPSQRIELPAR
jgi:uncharacterized hydrophobic protein (TIGR00271 family)